MNYIIGAGIAGLIYSFYNKGHIIISKDLKGQLNHRWPLGPRILQKNEYTEKLLKDLDLTCEVKTIYIGYSTSDNYYFRDKPSIDFRTKYYNNTRQSKSTMPDSVLSDNKSTIEYFDIDLNDLATLLLNKVDNVIYGSLESLDLDSSTFITANGIIHRYDNLVSTIPLSALLKLSDIKISHNFNTLDKIYVLTDNFINYYNEYDYIYYNGHLYNRVTKYTYSNQRYHIIEYTGKDLSEIRKQCENDNINIIDHVIQKNAQICNNINYNPFEKYNIKLIGRYSQWRHDIKIQDIVREVSNYGMS